MRTKNMINFFKCSHDVYEDPKFLKLKLSSQILYTHLCRLANRISDKKGWFYRSLTALEKDTEMSRRSITSSKKQLIENNFIDVKRGYFEHSKLRTYDYFRINGFRFKK